MSILNTISLESNKKIKINFNGGNLSSDGGLLLIKEFAAKVGLIKLVKKLFKTNDHTNSRIHTDSTVTGIPCKISIAPSLSSW